MKKEERVR